MIKVVRSYWDCCHSRKVQDLYDTGTCIDAELLPIRKYRILLTQVCQYVGIHTCIEQVFGCTVQVQLSLWQVCMHLELLPIYRAGPLCGVDSSPPIRSPLYRIWIVIKMMIAAKDYKMLIEIMRFLLQRKMSNPRLMRCNYNS